MNKNYLLLIKLLVLFFGLLSSNLVNSQSMKGEWVTLSNTNCKYFEPYYEPGFTATWSGGIKDGLADGTGILQKFINGNMAGKYEGPIINGHLQGKGKYTNKNGDVMEGNFEDGELNGCGTRSGKLPNGISYNYSGNFVHYFMHGDGKIEYSNGEIFEGKINMGNPYTGTYTNIKNQKKYIQRGLPVDKPTSTRSTYKPEIGKQQKEFFDENWNRCDMNKAKFYRLITYKSPNWPEGKVIDYYINGQIQSEFFPIFIDYDDDYIIFSEGEAIFYHQNGKLSQKSVRYGTSFKDTTYLYNENGKKIGEVVYDTPGGATSTTVYDDSGRIIRTFKTDELGNLIGNVKEYDSDGNGVEAKVWRFSDEPSIWVSDDNDSKSYIDKRGYLRLDTKRNDLTYTRRVKYPIDQSRDYMIESIVEQVDANDEKPYGIIFGFKNWDNYFEFFITGNKYYGLWGKTNGIEVNIIPFKKCNYINFGDSSNKIQIWKKGKEFIFAINSTFVDKCDAYKLEGDELGFAVIGKGQFAMDNLIVRQYDSLSSDLSTAQSQSGPQNPQLGSENTNSKKNDDGISIDGSGTGFFIDKRGYLATNYHVTKNAKGIYVCVQKDGVWESYHAIVVRNDPTNDLSIIRIDDPIFEQYPSLPYNFVTDVEDIAADIYTLGYPRVNVMGSDVKYTAGTINSKTGFQGDPTHYQISAHIDHGNSGGPMFNSKGAIVGITDGGLDKAEFGDVNYAIKSSYLKSLVDALPMKLNLPSDKSIETLSRVEQIKVLSKYTALILIDLP